MSLFVTAAIHRFGRRPWALVWLLCTFMAQLAGAQAPGGPKTLYLYDLDTVDPNGFDTGARPYLSRTPPISPQSLVQVDKNSPVTWNMTPALQAPFTIDAGTIPISLYLGKSGGTANPALRTITASLATTGALNGPLGAPVTVTFSAPARNDPAAVLFDIPLTSITTLPAGTQITLTLLNETPGGGVRRVRLFPIVAGDHSRIEMPALTVISVDATATFDAPFPAGNLNSIFTPGNDVNIRANVSDPFGTFDISNVLLDVFDDTGTPFVTSQTMSLVQNLSGAESQFEFGFTLPLLATGTWSYRVTAIEGTEGIVTDVQTGTFLTEGPLLTLSKSVSVLTDPVNGGTNPKAIPGAVMLYTVTVANSGVGGADTDTVVVGDVLPAETALYVGTGAGDPVAFIDGSPPSGLGFDFAAAVNFSNQPGGGPPYNYVPSPDASGFDPLITGMQINPSGALSGNNGGGSPSFQLRYLSRIE